MTLVNERDCLAVAYNIAASMTKDTVERKFLMSELKKCPNASKSRLNFLSTDTPTDTFRASRGKDVYGKSIARQCIALPLSTVPSKMLQAIGCECTIYSVILLNYLSLQSLHKLLVLIILIQI